MSDPSKSEDNPGFVRIQDCRERHGVMGGKIDKIELAMFGLDGRGGMVKDIGDIKKDLSVATGFLRTIILPIALPLIVGVIMYFVGRGHL